MRKLLDVLRSLVDRLDVMFAATSTLVLLAAGFGLSMSYPGGKWAIAPFVITTIGAVAAGVKAYKNYKTP